MRCGGMNVQFTELAPEGEMLFWRDVLVAEEDHEIFGQGAVDFVDLAVRGHIVGDQPAEIDAGYLRADDRGELFDRDGLVGRAVPARVAVARALLAGE